MITQQEDRELVRCRRLIEEKVGWGRSDNWSTQDFERLGEQIADQTGVSLSVTTLKRVWGRVRYNSAPTATTLNALVKFIGYTNWPHFKGVTQTGEMISEPADVVSVAVSEPASPVRSSGRSRWWIGAGLLVGVTTVWLFFLNYSPPEPLSPNDFSFSSRPVTKGIPNSVVFHYNAMASPTDSVFIQQSWDPSRRQLVPKNGHDYTSIYYYPGYFRAKLVVGRQVMQEHNLMIPSDGWHVAVIHEPVPVYFQPNEVIRNGVLSLSVAAIEKHNIAMQPHPPIVRYRYVRELDGLRADNFTLETRLKNDFKQGSSACQNMVVTILCKNEMFSIPLSAKGCVANLNLYLAGHFANAKSTDLSAFGADLSQWVDLRCDVRNKHVRLFVGGKKAYEAVAPNSVKDIVGISYDFEGTGSVDYVRFSRPNGMTVFEDNFNSSEIDSAH
ncbi:hypothetical protein [Spirosoma flavum]|uniref:Uncharacterized protein n=1 Tax=Spirosoma flavum TaxID=2048557 RepID=A0ABW6AG47_9BACT